MQTKIIAEASVVIALTVILKDVVPPIYRFPQGGSVSMASMVPLLWFSLRWGLRWGLEVSCVYGLVHMALPSSYIVDPVQALLDYPMAFAMLGLAGAFKQHPLVGVCVGVAGRFTCHFVSGIWFFSEYAGSQHPLVYSALYNGSYLVPELIISLVAMSILLKRKLVNVNMSKKVE